MDETERPREATPEAQAATPPIPEQPKEAPRSLAEDPRLGAIETELDEAWEHEHGSRYESGDSGLFRPEYLDYVYGDPTVSAQSELRLPLKDRAQREFARRHPEAAAQYAAAERTRVYEHPNDDPAIKAVEARILEIANRSFQSTRDGLWGEAKAGEANPRDEQSRVAVHQWAQFVREYPEKAAAYRGGSPAIERALASQARQAELDAQDAARRAEPFAPRSLNEEPSFRAYLNEHLGDLIARVHEGVNYEGPITLAEQSAGIVRVQAEMLAEFAQANPELAAKYGSVEIDQAPSPAAFPEVVHPEMPQAEAWIDEAEIAQVLAETDETASPPGPEGVPAQPDEPQPAHVPRPRLAELATKASQDAARLAELRTQLGTLSESERVARSEAEQLWGTFEGLTQAETVQLPATDVEPALALTVDQVGDTLVFIESDGSRWQQSPDGQLSVRDREHPQHLATKVERVTFSKLIRRLFRQLQPRANRRAAA